MPDDSNNKRCDRCRCENIVRLKETGKKFAIGAGLLVLAGLLDGFDENESSNIEVEKSRECSICGSIMDYDEFEECWVCPICEHTLSLEDDELGLDW
jgi:hypothetical protein